MESAAVTVDTPLVPKDVPEGSGKRHCYHFVLVTPGREYTFLGNTPGQQHGVDGSVDEGNREGG